VSLDEVISGYFMLGQVRPG